MPATLLTVLGLFVCSAIRCEVAPAGLEGYWVAPSLFVTVGHRPFGVIACEPDGELPDVWWCGR